MKSINLARLLGATLVMTLWGIGMANGQEHSASEEAAPGPDSIDAMITAIYEAVSGPAGERDWERFRALFAEGARLIPTGGDGGPQVLSADDYIERVSPFFAENPFYETELVRTTERYGNIAQIFSTYESRRDPSDPEPFARGINSIQLHFDGSRWWVVTIFWQAESKEYPIPAEFLPE